MVPDRLLYRLMVDPLKEPSGDVVYLLCGNYRRDRTSFDPDFLLRLLVYNGLDVETSLSRIHIIGVFSEAQLVNAPSLVEEITENADIKLMAVQQLSKLFYSENAIGFENRAEFKGVVAKLKELCTINHAPLVASCVSKKRRNLSPEPMGGSYLRHAANVLVYLRELKGGDVSAQLVKHFDKRRAGKRVRLNDEDDEALGRITKECMRERIQDAMKSLRIGYREALKNNLMQESFNKVWEDWDQEQGAMIYEKVIPALDLLNLTGGLSNRRELGSLRSRVEALEKRYEA